MRRCLLRHLSPSAATVASGNNRGVSIASARAVLRRAELLLRCASSLQRRCCAAPAAAAVPSLAGWDQPGRRSRRRGGGGKRKKKESKAPPAPLSPAAMTKQRRKELKRKMRDSRNYTGAQRHERKVAMLKHLCDREGGGFRWGPTLVFEPPGERPQMLAVMLDYGVTGRAFTFMEDTVGCIEFLSLECAELALARIREMDAEHCPFDASTAWIFEDHSPWDAPKAHRPLEFEAALQRFKHEGPPLSPGILLCNLPKHYPVAKLKRVPGIQPWLPKATALKGGPPELGGIVFIPMEPSEAADELLWELEGAVPPGLTERLAGAIITHTDVWKQCDARPARSLLVNAPKGLNEIDIVGTLLEPGEKESVVHAEVERKVARAARTLIAFSTPAQAAAVASRVDSRQYFNYSTSCPGGLVHMPSFSALAAAGRGLGARMVQSGRFCAENDEAALWTEDAQRWCKTRTRTRLRTLASHTLAGSDASYQDLRELMAALGFPPRVKYNDAFDIPDGEVVLTGLPDHTTMAELVLVGHAFGDLNFCKPPRWVEGSSPREAVLTYRRLCDAHLCVEFLGLRHLGKSACTCWARMADGSTPAEVFGVQTKRADTSALPELPTESSQPLPLIGDSDDPFPAPASGWYEVSEGFVPADQVTQEHAFYVTTGPKGATIYREPSQDAEVAASVGPGQALTLSQREPGPPVDGRSHGGTHKFDAAKELGILEKHGLDTLTGLHRVIKDYNAATGLPENTLAPLSHYPVAKVETQRLIPRAVRVHGGPQTVCDVLCLDVLKVAKEPFTGSLRDLMIHLRQFSAEHCGGLMPTRAELDYFSAEGSPNLDAALETAFRVVARPTRQRSNGMGSTMGCQAWAAEVANLKLRSSQSTTLANLQRMRQLGQLPGSPAPPKGYVPVIVHRTTGVDSAVAPEKKKSTSSKAAKKEVEAAA
eukprot:TRINITY_DN13759_c0_g1_i1.p1 TRINITY_DN13759_c0_g1~~TRINITY_DN13759_c0_g1_i1.p1  ORF type:complete len:963 (+),score=207.08 TRINITY_DN13759_c0_g1_i1:77-2890(+)